MTVQQTMTHLSFSRRQFLLGSGSLIVAVALGEGRSRVSMAAPNSSVFTSVPAQTGPVRSLDPEQVDTFLAISPTGDVTIYSGKVELGTGVETALTQIAAEELKVSPHRISMVMGDTSETTNQGYTAGSQTIQSAGPPLREAAATARQVLMQRAAELFGVQPDQLEVQDGTIRTTGTPTQDVTYGDLIAKGFDASLTTKAPEVKPSDYTIVGTSLPRVDIPGKLFAQFSYVQDLKLEGMLHGRVVRPWMRTENGVGATVQSVDASSVKDIPTVQVIHKNNFVGVVAETEWQAITAAMQLKVNWKTTDQLPAQTDLYAQVRKLPIGKDQTDVQVGDVPGAMAKAAKTLKATYNYPFQAHASIGPSCGVADVKPDSAVIYSATQGVNPLQGAIAQLLGMTDNQVRVIYMEGSGCYGHNGADDAAADAAVLSQAVGKPVRVQWMREGEFAWEPKGPAMVIDTAAGLDTKGNISAWDYAVWTPTFSGRPGGQAGNLLAAQLVDPSVKAKNGYSGGDRNAATIYQFPNARVVAHYSTGTFLRQSALRSLGAMANNFANESFIDELAAAAQVDAVEYRLRYLNDPRSIAVVKHVAALANWQSRPSGPQANTSTATTLTGRGIAFCQYETKFTRVGVVAEVSVDKASGQVRATHVYVAHDCGLIINPDGLRLQIEGNVIQGASRALKEQITFNQTRVTSLDWSGYHILTFPEIPSVDIDLIDQPNEPAFGAGEPTTSMMSAAIGNAIFDATGVRLRTVPFTPDAVKAAMASGSSA